ncbi:hypothetical protein HanOQP8_Chr17g0676101 [Helianthus annuus]|nr:hypothetical protein HanHA89_Chr17g0722941 [Helianthus annuus]KAJ0637629.1 hypothetical protein HanOQP8_Chr17g0676101 [Helianthus annuus]
MNKVWDVAIGTKEYTFEGDNNAPVYCVYPHFKENIQVNWSDQWSGVKRIGSRLKCKTVQNQV